MDDFNTQDFSSPNAPKNNPNNTGLKVFLIMIGVVCMLTIFVFLGFTLFMNNTEGNVSTTTSIELTTSTPSSNTDSTESITSTDNTSSKETQSTDNSGSVTVGGVIDIINNNGLLQEISSEEIAQKVMPSIVGIVSYQLSADNVLSEYGSGSGIIMSTDGYIITNSHVILSEYSEDLDKLEVYLDNGEIYVAEVVGYDTKTDLAVLNIEANNLVAAEFGDSTELQVGEKAIAIGNPTGLALASSFTQGVISGVNRQVESGDSGYYVNYIQTDAAINPGNSGGALVNKYGQVVGVNTSKIAATEYEGLGFAIPMDETKDVVNDLIEYGYVANRARLGISFTSITPAMSEVYGVPTGMRVVIVDETTDAYKKGVLIGDIITHVEGVDVIDLADVSQILKNKRPGDTVKITIYRNGQTLDLDIILSSYVS